MTIMYYNEQLYHQLSGDSEKEVTVVSKRPAILIVDDEETICDIICEELSAQGYVCDVALNAEDALVELKRRNFDVALLDIKLPGISGIGLLRTIEKCYQMTAIIMITAVKDVDAAVFTVIDT